MFALWELARVPKISSALGVRMAPRTQMSGLPQFFAINPPVDMAAGNVALGYRLASDHVGILPRRGARQRASHKLFFRLLSTLDSAPPSTITRSRLPVDLLESYYYYYSSSYYNVQH